MSKTREYTCLYYENEGNCVKGREGTFYHYCQTCDMYKKKPGAKAARENLKKKKLQDAKIRDMRGEM